MDRRAQHDRIDGELVVSGRRTTRNEDDHLERHGYVDHFTATGWQALGIQCSAEPTTSCASGPWGELIAYGSFVIAGDDTARNIARWTGSAWEPIGEGFDGPATMASCRGGWWRWGGSRVQAIHTGSRLLVGRTVAGPGRRVAVWRRPGEVISLSESGDSLFVVGWFDCAGQDSTDGVALWTGDAWRGLPGSSDPDWRLYDGRSAVLKG